MEFQKWINNTEVLKTAMGLMFKFGEISPTNMKLAEKLVNSLKERKDGLYITLLRTYQGWQANDICENLQKATPYGYLTPQDKESILHHFGVK